MRNHDLADGLGLLTCKAQQGDTQAAALLSYINHLETRVEDMSVVITELRAELRDRTQQVQAYKELTR